MTEYGLLWLLWARVVGPLPGAGDRARLRRDRRVPPDLRAAAAAGRRRLGDRRGGRGDRRRAVGRTGGAVERGRRSPRGRSHEDALSPSRLHSPPMTTPKRTIATLLSAGLLLAAPGTRHGARAAPATSSTRTRWARSPSRPRRRRGTSSSARRAGRSTRGACKRAGGQDSARPPSGARPSRASARAARQAPRHA